MRNAAEWLARLHASEVRLPRYLSLARELESTRQWTAQISREHPAAVSTLVLAAGLAGVVLGYLLGSAEDRTPRSRYWR